MLKLRCVLSFKNHPYLLKAMEIFKLSSIALRLFKTLFNYKQVIYLLLLNLRLRYSLNMGCLVIFSCHLAVTWLSLAVTL